MNELAPAIDPATVPYTLLNFHPLVRNGQVGAWLDDSACRPLVLRGELGSGRRYLLEAACHDHTLDAKPFIIAALDWAEILGAENPQAYFKTLLQQTLPDNSEGQVQWSQLAVEIADTMKQQESVAVMLLGAVLKFAVDQKLHTRIITRIREQKSRLNPERWQSAFRILLEELGAEHHLVLLLCNVDHFPQQGGLPRTEKTNTLWHYYDTCALLDKEYWQQTAEERQHGRVLFACTVLPDTPPSALSAIAGDNPQEIAVTPINEKELKDLIDQRFNPNRFGRMKNWLGGHALNRNFVRFLYDYARLEGDGQVCHPSLLAEACAELLHKGILLEGEGGWQLAPQTKSATLEKILGQPLREIYPTLLQAIPSVERDAADKFMRWAGMMNPLIPWNLLLQYFREVEKVDAVRLDATLRQHYFEANGLLEWVTDDVPHTPENNAVTFARYVNPLLAASLRPVQTRTQWAKELLKKLRNYHQPDRNTAQLFLHLAAQAGKGDYDSMRSELGWWLDEQYADIYEAMLNTQLQMGLVKTGDLVNLLMRNQNWSIHRRRVVLSVCKRYYAQHGGIPSQIEARWYWATIGQLERDLGNFNAAIMARKKQLNIEEKKLKFTNENIELADTIHALAVVLRMQGKHRHALPLFQRALRIKEAILGKDHLSTARTLNSLAVLYDQRGNAEQALPLYERSLIIREKVLGANILVASIQHNLAGLYDVQGKYAEALPLYEHSLVIREKVLGGEHSDVAMSLHGLASLYQKQGKYAEALPLYERSLVINEKVLGVEHPVVASNLNDLARLYYVQGDYIQALSLFERAIRIAEKKLGRQHPITRRIRKNYRLCQAEWEQANAEPPSS
ncbi:MAG: hypothetical protein BWK73_21485 [Thiothrix lacustris]|uniref:Uncharacterized protein n=1 Tax=Thiothrix lacustris TaxID=525917 RepID=A0A1Y1QNE8_9GAMM|nr:MAG: hypothetical protein BWK73_21485 [Thiothrix lacustris]